ncbi:hypothetical protein E2P81_ATG01822 [Venturia nashicola]|nr:hypothetical protein E2P81_ATG01822 [Venturia nashicola]
MHQKRLDFRIKSFTITEGKCSTLPTTKTNAAATLKTSSTGKKPTSFLSLPRELRQQVLLSAWSITNVNDRWPPFQGRRTHLLKTVDEIFSTASHLSLTLQEIEEDVTFVVSKWIEELRIYLEEGVKKRRSLNNKQRDKESRRDFEVARVNVAGWVVEVEFMGGFYYEKGTGLKESWWKYQESQ